MSNPYSYSSVKLDLFSKEHVHLGQASGFVLETADLHYLITNRHVLYNHNLRLHTHDKPATEPYILKTAIHLYGGEIENSFPLSWGMWKKTTIQIYDHNDSPTWFELPAYEQNGTKSDIAAIPIQLSKILKFNQTLMKFGGSMANRLHSSYWTKISALPIKAIDTQVEYNPPDRVYIVGYPIGWAPAGDDKSSPAFWRTSSIASELDEIRNIQANTFFIDPCAPRGMSGSPVIGIKQDRLKLLGVYSDSSTAEFGANAGLAWNASLIKELIDIS